ncbi:GRASP55/65 PDZ-like domain-containing protein [Umbelopsis sp. PMI_123]|nr:GRASP55/65 PDZ-like domain-containing protein [Umbelopsis sp. PMI_123]
MGGVQSGEDGRHGFHVLKVKENSPAYHAGIEQFFDYIISINGHKLDDGNSELLQEQFAQNVDKSVVLEVYSSKEQSIREVTIVPSKSWHTPDKPEETSLIGCSIRFCSYENAGEHVWHVLDVAENSPAEMAGVIPHTDYIIGSPHMTLRSEDDFYALVEDSLGKPLRLYLYNTEWDSCREVIIIPNHEWGGQGSLGCDVGYGLLHRIPRRQPQVTSSYENNPAEHENSSSQTYSNTLFSTPDYQPSQDVSGQTEQFGNVGLVAPTEIPSTSGSSMPSMVTPAIDPKGVLSTASLFPDASQTHFDDIANQVPKNISEGTPVENMLSKQLEEARISEMEAPFSQAGQESTEHHSDEPTESA